MLISPSRTAFGQTILLEAPLLVGGQHLTTKTLKTPNEIDDSLVGDSTALRAGHSALLARCRSAQRQTRSWRCWPTAEPVDHWWSTFQANRHWLRRRR